MEDIGTNADTTADKTAVLAQLMVAAARIASTAVFTAAGREGEKPSNLEIYRKFFAAVSPSLP